MLTVSSFNLVTTDGRSVESFDAKALTPQLDSTGQGCEIFIITKNWANSVELR
jgi:hypothetical protein